MKEKEKEIAVDVFISKACNASETCKALGISRNCFYEWKRNDKEFAQKINDAELALIDMAESVLWMNIKKGKETSLIFFLTNRAPDRWKHKSEQQQTVKMEFEGDVNITDKFKEHADEISRRFGFPL